MCCLLLLAFCHAGFNDWVTLNSSIVVVTALYSSAGGGGAASDKVEVFYCEFPREKGEKFNMPLKARSGSAAFESSQGNQSCIFHE